MKYSTKYTYLYKKKKILYYVSKTNVKFDLQKYLYRTFNNKVVYKKVLIFTNDRIKKMYKISI